MAITTSQITITTMEGWYSGATPPLNPLIGDLWLDTTNNEIKKYDGTNWIKQADTQGPQGPKGDSMISRVAYWIKSSISPEPPDPETGDMKGWIKGSEPPESALDGIQPSDKFWRTYKETYSNGESEYNKYSEVELIGSYEILNGLVQFRNGVTTTENGITVIDGGKIHTKSIKADRIQLEDLEALKATIGGFHIGKNSIYSGTKQTIDSIEKGIYFDSNGQSYFGDDKNFIRFFRSDKDNYKLQISADSLTFGSGVSVEKAFEDIESDVQKAQDTADSKRRVFYNTPTVPYDAGDLWVQGSDGDIFRCAQAKTSADSYDRNDWILASKYTDDSALTTWIKGDFATTIQGLEEGLADAKIETYYQATDPSTGWLDTQKSEHEGDLWYNSTASVQKYYRWSGIAWQELTATPPKEVFDSIDNKATIYTGEKDPSTPSEGDLWFKGADEPILTYVGNAWIEYNKYTNDDALKSWLANTYTVDKTNLQNQIDGKAETWYQNTDPSSNWSADEKPNHEGDLWYNTSDNTTWYYTGSNWSQQNIPTSVFNNINGKANIFIGSTTPDNPKTGDLWMQSDKTDILTYVNGSWLKYNKYTDDTKAEEAIDKAEAASKTATDFIAPQTTDLTDDGIKIFPKAEKDNPQNYSQINQNGMQIYKGGQETASFGSEKISLGENSEQSVLEMCGGLTSLNSEVTQNAAGDKIGYILLSPTPLAQGKNYPFECGIASTNRDAMVLIGNSSFSLGSDAKSGIPSINYIASQLSGYSEFDANEEYPEDGPYAYTSIGMHAGMGMSDGSEPAAGIGMDAHLDNETGKVKSTMDIYADDLTIDVKNLNLVNSNEQVWSGAWFMNGSQSINTHKTIEQIPNGIVLAFSRYLISNSEVSNTNWHYEFIPKWHLMNSLNPNASAGIIVSWTGPTQQYSIAKYMYAKINNSGAIVISGNDNNVARGTGANGVKYDNRNAVLRAVLIV